MNVFHQDTLVLEDVTLGFEVEFVVHVFVDLALFAVFAEQATEDTLATHPEDGGGHTGFRGTLALTGAGVTTLALGGQSFSGTESGRRDGGLLEDETRLDELADSLACIEGLMMDERKVIMTKS